ncbi:hypothetical protein B0H16DRAFT_1303507, partial [Mycena metata]
IGGGGGNGGNLKTLNTGWQVWGSSPASKRNASMSSLASVGGDMQGDSSFRSNAAEPWAAPRSASGAWDDNALKKDFSALVRRVVWSGETILTRRLTQDPQSQLNLRPTRQRQPHGGQFPPSREDRPTGSKGSQPNPPRYSAASKPLGAGAYTGQQPSFPLPSITYDSLQPSAAVEHELSAAMRGMAVEDDLNAMNARQHAQSAMPIPPQVANAQMRGAPTLPQQRNMYNTYPTTEYGFYPPGRDSFADYSYVSYGSPDPSLYAASGVPMSPGLYAGVPQNLHPSSMDIRQQQPQMYFDYGAAARPPSQFYFPPPPPAMMYTPQHSPMLSSLPPPSPVTLAEKKREMQVCVYSLSAAGF